MNDTMRHLVGLAIAVGGFLLGIIIMFAAGWRPAKIAGTRIGMALGGILSFAEAAGRWRRSPSAGINPGKVGTAGMLTVGVVMAIAATALQRVALIVLGLDESRGFGNWFFRDFVSVAVSPGVLAGAVIAIYARRMARHIFAGDGTTGAALHDAIMVPSILSLVCAVAASTTARLAAFAFIPMWNRGKPLSPLHDQIEIMLLNIAAGMIVIVLSAWSENTGKTIRQLGQYFISWWGIRVGLYFALPWVNPMAKVVLGKSLAAALLPAVPNLVWIGIYCSIIAGAWLRTEGNSAKFAPPKPRRATNPGLEAAPPIESPPA